MNHSKIKATFLFLFVAQFFITNAQNNFSLQDLKWLTGSWIDSDSTIVQKCDLVNGNLLLGEVRKFESENLNLTESLEIKVVNNVIAYRAMPQQNSSYTEFTLFSDKNETWVFENQKHDFPNEIIYKKVNNNQIKITLFGNAPKMEFMHFRFMPEEITNDKK